jgi:hypothetical protein
MAHDPGLVQMGTTRSSSREVDNREGTIAPGIACRLKTDGTLSSAAADGNLLGVSVGKDLSNAGRTAVVRKGLQVPVRLAAGATPAIGAAAFVNATGEFAESGTAVNAIYVSEAMDLREEDGTIVPDRAALIDMPGGL